MSAPSTESSSEPLVSLDPLAAEDFAAQLIRELDQAETWPLPRERKHREAARLGRAFRKGDRHYLKRICGWDMNGGDERDYHVDNLARRVAFGFADFLFAEDVTITAAEGDQPDPAGEDDQPSWQEAGEGNATPEVAQAEIDRIVEATRMPALLHRAERIAVSEGEAWWKLHVNRVVADCALLTFNSRLDVIPLFYGDLVLAAGFVTERRRQQELYQLDDTEHTEVVYRQVEIHTHGRVVNVLYRGTEEALGARVDLYSIPETAGYAPEWNHGLPMLAGRVVNDLDDDPCMGVGEYETIQDQLLDINEAVTIAAENARLTGQDRVFAAGRFMQADGTFDASLQVFQVEDDQSTLGEGQGKPPIVAIEKHYDAQPLWMHISELTKTALNRVGLVPQWVGEDVKGSAESGLAIRLRFIPTTNAAKGKQREWAHVIPRIVDMQLRVAQLPVSEGGFGRPVAQDEPPAVEFADPIPQDQSRDLLDVSAAVVSEVMSRRTAIAILHPEWTDDQVDAELQAIDGDREAGILPPEPQAMKPVHPPSSVK